MAVTLSRRQVEMAHLDERPALDLDGLFQQHWSRICDLLYRLIGEWDEAEDLALETFVRLYNQPPGMNENLVGWLYRVATNLGLNALRARQRRQRYEMAGGLALMDDGLAGDPAQIVIQDQERARVRAVLQKMRPRSAQLLIMRYSGLSYAELAEALQLSPGSIGTLLARAEREFEQKYRELERRC